MLRRVTFLFDSTDRMQEFLLANNLMARRDGVLVQPETEIEYAHVEFTQPFKHIERLDLVDGIHGL